MSEQKDIAAGMREPVTPAQRIRSDWKALVSKMSYKGITSNIPYLAFIVVLCIIYISNSHRAIETQRELNKQEQVLKERSWRYKDAKTKLMNAGMESTVMRSGARIGLKPLTLPAYSIVIDSNKQRVP